MEKLSTYESYFRLGWNMILASLRDITHPKRVLPDPKHVVSANDYLFGQLDSSEVLSLNHWCDYYGMSVSVLREWCGEVIQGNIPVPRAWMGMDSDALYRQYMLDNHPEFHWYTKHISRDAI